MNKNPRRRFIAAATDKNVPHNAAAADKNVGWFEGVGCPSNVLTLEGSDSP